MRPAAPTARVVAPRIVAPLVVAIVIVAVWQLVCSLGLVRAQVLPSPVDLAARVWLELTRGPLLPYAAVTLGEALVGSLIAVLVAVPLGYLIVRVRTIDLAATPYIAASQAIPAIALAPLLVLWIGYGLLPISILCAITAFFPMLVTTVLGVRALPADVLEAAKLDGSNWLQSLWWVEAPLALPSVLAGIRAGVTLSITGAVVGEFTMGGHGLGTLLTLFRDANDTEGLFATLAMLVALAVGLFLGLRILEAAVAGRAERPERPMRGERRAAERGAPVAGSGSGSPDADTAVGAGVFPSPRPFGGDGSDGTGREGSEIGGIMPSRNAHG